MQVSVYGFQNHQPDLENMIDNPALAKGWSQTATLETPFKLKDSVDSAAGAVMVWGKNSIAVSVDAELQDDAYPVRNYTL